MKKINIQVLGSGCHSCETLYKNVFEVARGINPELKVEYITDITKIIELGVMSMPVFAIDGEVITAGKIPSGTEIEQAILSKTK